MEIKHISSCSVEIKFNWRLNLTIPYEIIPSYRLLSYRIIEYYILDFDSSCWNKIRNKVCL